MIRNKGYTLIILLVVISIMSIGLLVAVPVWKTQIQREREEELIFRGKQYIEAVRLFQLKFPGRFPESMEELLEEKCIRKLFKDPVTQEGDWNIILHQESFKTDSKKQVFQKVMIAPQDALQAIANPQILGVVSTSTAKSIKIYNDQETYDKWLFFYGQDPRKMPEIVYYGQPKKK
jgi:type II secretory pathway pseudopilin PulG